MQSFECFDQHQIAGIISTSNVNTSESIKKNDSPWDSILRGVFRAGMFWEDVIPPKNRPIPLNIRLFNDNSNNRNNNTTLKSEEFKEKSKLIRVLEIANNMISDSIQVEENTGLVPISIISQWTILQLFIEQAIDEIQPILHSRLFHLSTNLKESPNENNDDFLIELLVNHIIGEEQSHLPGVLNLLLHMMHSLGILLGISIRSGTVANIQLPDYFWKIICNEIYEIPNILLSSSSSSLSPVQIPYEIYSNICSCFGHAIRHGITSCLPETYLDLLSVNDLKTLLISGGTLSINILRSSTSYILPLTDSDEVVEVSLFLFSIVFFFSF